MASHAGMDAVIFLRFTRMCRNIFLVLTILGGAILLPIYWTTSATFEQTTENITPLQWFDKFTPTHVWGTGIWGVVVLGYVFNFVVCGFLWWNYRKILQLRLHYFASDDYQLSLSARTLMVCAFRDET